MSKLWIIIITIIIFIFGCVKDDEDVPCVSFPCGESYDWIQPGNRVASDYEFRKGIWVNISDDASSPDTIIFHSINLWSNFNAFGGIYNGRYEFKYVYLKSYMDYQSIELDDPIEFETTYNDTTGIFSVLRQISVNNQNWNHYIKIE